MSRVDHHRRLFGNGITDILQPLRVAYRARVADDFAENGLAQFVQGLRNHLVHRGLPMLNSLNQFSAESWSIKVCLDRDNLTRWDKWSPKASVWLDNQEESIDIVAGLQDYGRIVSDFDAWICGSLAEIYKVDLGEFESARTAYGEAYMCAFDLQDAPAGPSG